MEFDDAEQWELLWALLYWRASVPEPRRMHDVELGQLIERVRAMVHKREVRHER